MNRFACAGLVLLGACFKGPAVALSTSSFRPATATASGGHSSGATSGSGSANPTTGSSSNGTLGPSSSGGPTSAATSSGSAGVTSSSSGIATVTSTASSGSSGGTCVPGSFCNNDPHSQCCNQGCTNISSDPANCGGCGQACSAGEACVQSSCVFASCDSSTLDSACALPGDGGIGECCGQGCGGVGSDPANCGGCGNTCGGGQVCLEGNCVNSTCSGVPDGNLCQLAGGQLGDCCFSTCVDLSSNPRNCGTCGLACSGNEVCVEDTCALVACPADGGELECADADGGVGFCCGTPCANLESDSANCGGCGITCAAGQICRFESCVSGDCAAPGAGGSTCALVNGQEGECCDQACVPIFLNADACGGCGIVCPTGTRCQPEEGDPPGLPGGGRCVGPNFGEVFCADAGCPAGMLCDPSFGACISPSCPAGSDGQVCLQGTSTGLCCNQVCVNEENDDSHCGTCGTVCASGQACQFGTCIAVVSCTLEISGSTCALDAGVGSCCHGACSGLDSPGDCGACGYGCPVGCACTEGACSVPDGGFVDCPEVPCAAGQICTGGRCENLSCQPGESGSYCAYGDGLASQGFCCDGVCTSNFSPGSCGGCGQTCESGLCVYPLAECLPVPGEDGGPCDCGDPSLLCIDGRCVVASPDQCAFEGAEVLCATDGGPVGECCQLSSGAVLCTAIDSDPSNCGACGFACPSGQTCSAGQCSGLPGACQGSPGRFCDLDGGGDFVCCADGCVDITSSPLNCGTCGVACGPDFVCANRECVVAQCTAATSEELCVGDGGDSVCCGTTCANLLNDEQNCGTCFNPCSSGQLCFGGECIDRQCGNAPLGTGCLADGGALGECCGSGCTNVETDPANCGGCGLRCDGGSCQFGSCL